MKLRPLLAALAVTCCGAVAVPGNAAPVAPAAPAVPMAREQTRTAREPQRIETGQADGGLTPMQARRLRLQQARIMRSERHDETDGVVTPKEAAHVERLQDRTSPRRHEHPHAAQGSVAEPVRR